MVASERVGDRTPEVAGVVGIGHRQNCGALSGARSDHLQAQLDIEAVLAQQRHVAGDGAAVIGPAVGGCDAVDAEPAVFVQWNADRVRRPGRDGGHRGVVASSVKEAPALPAGILGAAAVDAVQHHRPAVVDQMVARDAQIADGGHRAPPEWRRPDDGRQSKPGDGY